MTLLIHRRQWLRMALKLQACYERRRSVSPLEAICDKNRWRCLVRETRRLAQAAEAGMERLAAYFQPQVQSALQQLSSELTAAAAEVARLDRTQKRPSLRHLYEELTSLQDEFETVELDLRERQIIVETESIVLDDIELGPFEIRLRLDQLGSHSPYAVVALSPHCPASSDEITHPHVQHGTLCEGEGRHAIRQALEQGRVGDFFLLVSQILRTYNESSAYCALSAWQETPCADCGDLADDDRQSLCELCDCRLCDDCTRYCCECDATLCGECSSLCDACGARPCGRCLRSCAECGRSLCPECHGDELCPRCHELQTENLHESSPDPSLALSPAPEGPPQTGSSEAGALVQPVRLGEAAVSA